MAKFALACEGITDQIVIENILCGFYKNYDDLDEEIQPLQPPYFNVSQQSLSIESLIEKVVERLIAQIDSKIMFYEQNREKIIFAISVHSLECWILPLYNSSKKEKIVGCFEALHRESKKIKVSKDYRTYDKLSRDFLKHKKLMNIISKNSSFQIFINSLPNEI